MTDLTLEIRAQGGALVHGASLVAAYPNGTYLTGRTGADGKCRLKLYRADQKMTVLVAADGYLPFHTTVVPAESSVVSLEIETSKDDRKGLLFTRRTGYIPGISGCINPDKEGYVYGDNIAINGQLATPAAQFKIGECLHLIDVYGVETTIRFLVVEGEFSLIEYTKPTAYAGK